MRKPLLKVSIAQSEMYINIAQLTNHAAVSLTRVTPQ